MEWSQIIVIVLVSIFGAIFLVAIATLIVSFFLKDDFSKRSPSTLAITVDLNNDRVLVFSKKNLLGIQKHTIESYLKLFDKNSRKKLEDLFEIIRQDVSNEYDDIVETNCHHNTRKKRRFYSVFYINSINREKGIIHATQYFYENIPAITSGDLKKENKIRATFNVSENIIKSRFINSKGSKGASIQMRYEVSSSLKNEDISQSIFFGLVNIVCKYINSNRILIKTHGTDLVIHDFKVNKRTVVYKLVTEIKKEFIRILEMNNVLNRVSFHIGIAEHKFYPRDYNKINKVLHQTINDAVIKNREIIFYDNQVREEYYFDQSYKSEVATIIENHSMKYNFAPIISASSRCEVIGYFSKPVPISSVFSDINELKEYAYKLNFCRELFSEITKHLLSKFSNESTNIKGDCHLFYSLNSHEIGYANSLLSFIIASKKVNLALVFNEMDLLKNLNKNTDFTNNFRKLTFKGYKIGLEISLKTLEFPDEFYSLFDYFIFDAEYFEKNFDDVSHSSLNMKRAIEKILKFKKKVIVKSVNTANDLELRILENLKLISGDAIAPFSEMVLPVDKKVYDKIQKIKKKG